MRWRLAKKIVRTHAWFPWMSNLPKGKISRARGEYLRKCNLRIGRTLKLVNKRLARAVEAAGSYEKYVEMCKHR